MALYAPGVVTARVTQFHVVGHEVYSAYLLLSNTHCPHDKTQ